MHTNTFCKYRKKLRASRRVHLVFCITFTETLSWDNHVHLIKKKVSKVLRILYRLKEFNSRRNVKNLIRL